MPGAKTRVASGLESCTRQICIGNVALVSSTITKQWPASLSDEVMNRDGWKQFSLLQLKPLAQCMCIKKCTHIFGSERGVTQHLRRLQNDVWRSRARWLTGPKQGLISFFSLRVWPAGHYSSALLPFRFKIELHLSLVKQFKRARLRLGR